MTNATWTRNLTHESDRAINRPTKVLREVTRVRVLGPVGWEPNMVYVRKVDGTVAKAYVSDLAYDEATVAG